MATDQATGSKTKVSRKPEGVYPTNYGEIQAGNGIYLRFNTEAFDATKDPLRSAESTGDRMVSDIRDGNLSVKGAVTSNLVFGNSDLELAGVLQSEFVDYGTSGVSTAINFAVTATTLTASAAPTGVDALTGLSPGAFFKIIPASGASSAVKKYLAAKVFRVSKTVAPTATVLTLDANFPIDTNIVSALTEAKLSSSKLVNGSTMVSYTYEVAYSNGVNRVVTGCIASKVDLKVPTGQNYISLTADFLGSGTEMQSTSVMGTPQAVNTLPDMLSGSGFLGMVEDGSNLGIVQDLSLTIDGGLKGSYLATSNQVQSVSSPSLKCTGNITMEFVDNGYFNKVLSGTTAELVLPLVDSIGNAYVIVLPKTIYTAAKSNSDGRENTLTLKVDFEAVNAVGGGIIIYKLKGA